MAENSKTNDEIKRICAINRETVHKICSGQVVFNLAIAVKELVENAIDAGATNIDIRFKEYGSEFIEVCDNGVGVEEQNFEALTLKHCTSKLTSFSDLESISTLGFRGEALSSLCALSNLTVTTRHKSVEYGHKIEYDINGHVKNKTKCARQIGTTVTLTNLFYTLPVRHKDFIKNLKREFTKMCQLLYAYCLVTEGVRIVCTNQTKKGARTTIVATQGSKNARENIICVFGIKQLNTLTEMKLIEPDEKYLEDYGVKWTSGNELPFKVEGFISKCTHGSGRSATDRQFYYINSRPCEPTKIIKVVNEVYRYFNNSQYPFVFFNIKTSQSQIDVNVTPDKRQVFMEQEKLLLATLKTSLLEVFKEFPSTLRLQNTNLSIKTENTQKSLSESLKAWTKSAENILENKRGVKRTSEAPKPKGTMGFIFEKRLKVEENFSQNLSEIDSESEDEEKQIDKFIKESYNSSDSEPDLSVVISKPKRNTKPVLDKELKDSIKEFKNDIDCFKITINSPKTIDVKDIEVYEKKQSLLTDTFKTKTTESNYQTKAKTIDTQHIETYERRKQNEVQIDKNNDIDETTNYNVEIITKTKTIDTEHIETYERRKQNEVQIDKNDDIINETINYNVEIITKSEPSTSSQDVKLEIISKNESQDPQPSTSSSSCLIQKQNTFVDVNIPDLQTIMQKMRLSQEKEIELSQIKFRSELTSKNAESELERHISKDMFERMEIIGQFNKGFIITKLDEDLFIIDQHASDEKYNFETLQKTTVIQNQKLVIPKLLDLTADNELLLIDNLEIFKKNGFDFEIDENAPPREKVKLTAMPVSKNWKFGKEAIDELLFMLQEDAATESMRPSGIRAMFASRACRKSVMIGSALSTSDMRRLVDHMGQIDQPWNCPHGRPTMRHLINLDMIKIDNNSEEENSD